jgi:hypothetical protein
MSTIGETSQCRCGSKDDRRGRWANGRDVNEHGRFEWRTRAHENEDGHGAAAAQARMDLRSGGVVVGGLIVWDRHGEQFAGSRNVILPSGAGEQPVVTDAMETGGQDMNQEAADELAASQGS